MSICTPCLNTKPTPTCLGELIIGTVSEANATLDFFIRDNTLEKTIMIQATTDGAGLATADVSDIDFMPSHSYEGWLQDATGTLPITIGYSQGQTVCLNFEGTTNAAGSPDLTASHTLSEAFLNTGC